MGKQNGFQRLFDRSCQLVTSFYCQPTIQPIPAMAPIRQMPAPIGSHSRLHLSWTTRDFI